MLRTTPLTMGSIDPAARQGGNLARLLDALSSHGRLRFERMTKVRVAAPRSVIVSEGEDPDEIGFVLGGTLGTSRLLPDGRSHIVALVLPTDMFGRVHDGPALHRVESLSDARLLTVQRSDFEELLRGEPAAERLLLVQALEELDTARDWAIQRSGSKVVSRVASFLVTLAARSTSHPSRVPQVKLQLSRADLASYLGTRPETLSRALHDLADRKLIRILDPYRFEIDDLAALQALAGHGLGASDDPTL